MYQFGTLRILTGMTHAEPTPEVAAFVRAVAAQIRAERAAAGVTRDEITERTGIGRSTLYRIERGERVPDMVQLAQIASALPVTVQQIVQRASNRMVIDPGVTPPPDDDA